MIFENMPHHENQLPFLGEFDQLSALMASESKGFLHEHMLPGFKCLLRERVVLHGRRGDYEGIDAIALQHCFIVSCRCNRILPPDSTQRLFIHVADHLQRPQRMKIAHEVLTPIAGASDGNTRHLRTYVCFGHALLLIPYQNLRSLPPPRAVVLRSARDKWEGK